MGLAPLIAVLASLAQADGRDANGHAETAAAAWNRGDLRGAGEHAVLAYDALAQGPCLATPDGARLAFMAGLAAQAGLIDGYAGYYFWAARQLHRVAGGLDQAQSAVSRELGAEPGRRPGEDWRFIGSPFVSNPYPRRGQDCSPVLPALVTDPPVLDAAVAIAWTRYPDGQYGRLQSIYAYPDRAGRALAARIEGTYNPVQTAAFRGLKSFAFTPCYTAYDEARLPFDLCLDGAPAP